MPAKYEVDEMYEKEQKLLIEELGMHPLAVQEFLMSTKPKDIEAVYDFVKSFGYTFIVKK